MSTTVQVLTMLKGLQQNQWLTEDSKTQVVKVATKGWFSGHGLDGKLIEKTIDTALDALKARDPDVAEAMLGVEAALERRQMRALWLDKTEEHTCFYNLKNRVHEAMEGVLILTGNQHRNEPLKLKSSKPKTIIAAAKLCFSPSGTSSDSLLCEILKRVSKQEAHTPSPAVFAPKALPAAPKEEFKGSPPPSQTMLLDAMKRMGLRGNGDNDTPYEDECARLAAMDV